MSMTPAARPTFGEANFAEAQLGDIRRTRRLVALADALRRHPGGSLPDKLPSPRNLKALYRLCSREEVTHQAVLAPHRAHTQRLWAEHGTVLILHDSTELDYSKRKSLVDLGDIGGPGRHRGYICHNSLAVLPEDGSVLGLFNQILHKRVKPPKKETKTQLRNRKSRMSRLWLEGVAELPGDRRLVDVCDRGADTFEFLEHELNSGRRFVVRSSYSRRLVPPSSSTITKLFLHAHLRAQRAWGKYAINVRALDGMPARKARLSISGAEVRLIPAARQEGPPWQRTVDCLGPAGLGVQSAERTRALGVVLAHQRTADFVCRRSTRREMVRATLGDRRISQRHENRLSGRGPAIHGGGAIAAGDCAAVSRRPHTLAVAGCEPPARCRYETRQPSILSRLRRRTLGVAQQPSRPGDEFGLIPHGARTARRSSEPQG